MTRYVALGSSMAAGPGISPRAEGSPRLAMRSARNYPHLVAAALGLDLKELVFAGRTRELERTDRSQPALFAVEYALARLLEHRGVLPSVLVGHSVGEYVAAHDDVLYPSVARPADDHTRAAR